MFSDTEPEERNITLKWKAGVHQGKGEITYWRLEMKGNTDRTKPVTKILTRKETSITFHYLTPSLTYHFSLKACSANYGCSRETAEISVTTLEQGTCCLL